MRKLITFYKSLPKKHQSILAAVTLLVVVVLLLPTDDAAASRDYDDSKSNQRIDLQLDLSSDSAQRQPNTLTPVRANISASKATSEVQAPTQTETKITETSYTVESGDSLGKLFSRAGLSPRDTYDVTQLAKAKKSLIKIMPGEHILIRTNENGQFAGLTYDISKTKYLVVNKDDKGLSESVFERPVEMVEQFAGATITSNFWNAGITAGLTPAQIMNLAEIFGWNVDFALDIRKGDHFSVLYEKKYIDGEAVGNGNIIAARFSNQGESFDAIRYSDGQYYNSEGRAMKGAFLRSPVDFTRVSSNFNPRRLHPVTGNVRPHNGVDYVAPVGTPIKAAGNGRVVASTYNNLNGNYVFIKHSDTYTTKYLHLSKRRVKKGDYVKQGQIIGNLGATGRVTGAHLHYEFIVNGVHRNPRTVKLPKSEPIKASEREKFLALAKPTIARLEQQQQLRMASSQ
ncbi:peptidoglycan DD-metalloendopeptidase family protein [Paraferrimonas haliotis]|uniref:Family M23 zinc metallopeptidase with OapA domain protein n=1 Tax=Paraferrimonas haliotis TaxID=2013866 RepID=A0AA37TNW4_9GAMM|nr:peptidoglycan DD-metalloendopeptidase family protein [Paraferrimonas haliotis]GLS83123.1 family M23 zinc metallopeptidase with OapA domain protein [Paraferrimonas haliotis]